MTLTKLKLENDLSDVMEAMEARSAESTLDTVSQRSGEIYKTLKKHQETFIAVGERLKEIFAELENGLDDDQALMEMQDEVEDARDCLNSIFEYVHSINTGTVTDLISSSTSMEDWAKELEAKGRPGLNESIAKFLKVYNKLKSDRGLETQADVAKLTGIDRRYISEIEAGKRKPQFKTVKRIADAFGVDVNVFAED